MDLKDLEGQDARKVAPVQNHCHGTLTFPCIGWPGITTVIPGAMLVVAPTPHVTGTAVTDTPGGSIPGSRTLSLAPKLNKALMVGSDDTAALTSADE